eukprot:1157290-Pelagomonas_calceolata.AAC.2
MSEAVARATRNTTIGRNFLPPAPKICSAAAISIGCLSPTTFFKFTFIVSMSACAGATIEARSESFPPLALLWWVEGGVGGGSSC